MNGKSLGKKNMPKYGHISWPVTYKSGKLVATGYRDGKKVAEQVLETPGYAAAVVCKPSRTTMSCPSGRSVVLL